ncbi:MAG: M35 family metallo-endopeptidase [Crocosphaera sp.]|nr:M35 family metallo-endopeptidase [Crocosphaera sp.]
MAHVNYTNFGNDERKLNQAKKAFIEASLLLGKAKLGLRQCLNNDRLERDLYTKWFGTYSPARIQVVDGIIQKMLAQLSTRAITIDGVGGLCRPGEYAYVLTAAVGGGLRSGVTIFLCNQFFQIPLYGKGSQVGTILHEITHLVGATVDHANGQTNCQRLAKRRPTLAINNGDSYTFYIESFKTNTR